MDARKAASDWILRAPPNDPQRGDDPIELTNAALPLNPTKRKESMTMNKHYPHVRPVLGLAVTGLVVAAFAAPACGGSKSTATSAPTTAATAAANGSGPNGTPGRGFGNRTSPPAIQTSIAEGTPGGSFRNGTPSAGIETAIAEGTRPAGFGGGGRTLAPVATLLNIPAQQLQSELQQAGATIASVAAAHGVDRATVRQALIDAERQRLAASVSIGRIAQADADTSQSQFEATVDQLLDSNGMGPGGTGGPPPAPAQ